MHEVPQTQFIPLADAICIAISSLNDSSRPATLGAIVEMIRQQYSGIPLPHKVKKLGVIVEMIRQQYSGIPLPHKVKIRFGDFIVCGSRQS